MEKVEAVLLNYKGLWSFSVGLAREVEARRKQALLDPSCQPTQKGNRPQSNCYYTPSHIDLETDLWTNS